MRQKVTALEKSHCQMNKSFLDSRKTVVFCNFVAFFEHTKILYLGTVNLTLQKFVYCEVSE